MQTFSLKFQYTKWQKDRTFKTSSEKLTLTCVNRHSYAFSESGFTIGGSKISRVFQYICPKNINNWFKTWLQTIVHSKSRLQNIALRLCQRKLMKVQERWVSIPEKKNISATFSGNLGKFAKVHLAHLVALVRFANLIHCLQLNATSRATRMNLYQK